MQLSRRALFRFPRPPAPASDGFWLHLSRAAMACKFEITLPSELGDCLDAVRAALAVVDELEQQLSIFRDSSELSAINREAFAAPVPVEERLFQLLCECQRLSAVTGGAFDIT